MYDLGFLMPAQRGVVVSGCVSLQRVPRRRRAPAEASWRNPATHPRAAQRRTVLVRLVGLVVRRVVLGLRHRGAALRRAEERPREGCSSMARCHVDVPIEGADGERGARNPCDAVKMRQHRTQPRASIHASAWHGRARACNVQGARDSSRCVPKTTKNHFFARGSAPACYKTFLR